MAIRDVVYWSEGRGGSLVGCDAGGVVVSRIAGPRHAPDIAFGWRQFAVEILRPLMRRGKPKHESVS